MKRIAFLLSALGCSLGGMAALPAATDPTLVAVPQLPGGWVIGAGAYYLQPSSNNGDLDYAIVKNSAAATIKNIDPDYSWGWSVNAGYIFPATGNDFNINYFHFDTDTKKTVTGTVANLATTEGVNIPGFADEVLQFFGIYDTVDYAINSNRAAVSGKANFEIDQVDLTLGQYLDVGCRLVFHAYTGLRWADFERQLNTTAQSNVNATFVPIPTNTVVLTATGNTQEKSDLDGVGPILGLDGSYYLGNGFGVVGHLDGAVLIGSVDSKMTTQATGNIIFYTPPTADGDTFINNGYTTKTDNTRLVPAFDAKLGLDYTFVFNNVGNSDLTVEAGWQDSHYFNAIDRNTIQVTPDPNDPINNEFIVSYGHKTADFALQGPYVNLTWHI